MRELHLLGIVIDDLGLLGGGVVEEGSKRAVQRRFVSTAIAHGNLDPLRAASARLVVPAGVVVAVGAALRSQPRVRLGG